MGAEGRGEVGGEGGEHGTYYPLYCTCYFTAGSLRCSVPFYCYAL